MIKKFFIVLLLLLFALGSVLAETLKGSVSATNIPKGFFGTWHVTSKLESSDGLTKFNNLSVDIWNLSGYSNVLILENPVSGASSTITFNGGANSLDGQKLRFTRVKTREDGPRKVINIEKPEITLDGNIFRGFDLYIIEIYENNVLIARDSVKYKLIGQKIE